MINTINIKDRIESLTRMMEETNETIRYLNILVSQNITARDNQIKKKESLQKNIDKLNDELDGLAYIKKMESKTK